MLSYAVLARSVQNMAAFHPSRRLEKGQQLVAPLFSPEIFDVFVLSRNIHEVKSIVIPPSYDVPHSTPH